MGGSRIETLAVEKVMETGETSGKSATKDNQDGLQKNEKLSAKRAERGDKNKAQEEVQLNVSHMEIAAI